MGQKKLIRLLTHTLDRAVRTFYRYFRRLVAAFKDHMPLQRWCWGLNRIAA